MNTELGRMIGVRIWGVLLSGLGIAACGDAFNDDCAATHSCTPPADGDAGEGNQSNGGMAGTGDGQGNGGIPAELGGGGAEAVGAGAGGEAAGPCVTAADCSNGDASDGEELCVAGVCEPGNAPPSVLSITPSDGAADAQPDAVVVVELSEPLDPKSVRRSAFRLFDGDVEVTGSLKLSSTRDQLRFTPDEALELWVEYRVEIARELSDEEGATLLDDVVSTFTVRDGAWSVMTLAGGEDLQLPPSLPIVPTGALLTAWLETSNSQCNARGAWVLSGENELGDSFESAKPEAQCSDISASIASDGTAVAGWSAARVLRSQSFVDGSWAASDRATWGYTAPGSAINLRSAQAFAHDAQRMSVLMEVSGGATERRVASGPTRGEWAPPRQYSGEIQASRAEIVFDDNGDGIAVWSDNTGISILAYDASGATWAAETLLLPGTDLNSTGRGVPNIARSPDGEMAVIWLEGTNGQVVKSSRFSAGDGWDSGPATLATGLTNSPMFDQPGLVFDGETFLSAWTAKSAGKLAAYTARYDRESKKWSKGESHVSDSGPSTPLMPRLGVDARGNLMLVWAIAGDPMKLAYQRYRADTETWGDILAVEGVAFSDSTFETEGKLPFAFAPNRTGGVMFRTDEADGSQSLKLARFF